MSYENIDLSTLDDIDKVTEMMARLTKMVDEFETKLAPLEEQATEVENSKKALKQEYEERMLDLNAKSRSIQEMMYEAKRDLRALKRDAESVSRQYHELQRAKQLSDEYATLEKRWDLLTAGAPWREFAMDHQLEAGRKITWSQRMILGDTMGLGKTLSSVIALDMIKAATADATEDNPFGGEITERSAYNYSTGQYEHKVDVINPVVSPCGIKVLYFCPATMLGNVEREIRRWAPYRSVVILGGQSKATRRFLIDTMKSANEYVVIVNYEAWRRDKQLISDLIDLEFDTVIIDEAHNVKDRKSIAYRGIKQIIDETGIKFVVPMTGTPILNKPQELFSLLTFTDPRRFSRESQFLYDYCDQDPFTGRWKFRPGGVERLSKLIGSRFLRRTKDQVGIKLPPLTILTHEIEIDEERYPEQARARNEMRKWGSVILDPENGKAITAAAMIAVYTRLRQIETWPAGIEIKDQFGDIAARLDIEESQKLDEIIRPNGPNNSYADAEGILPEVVGDERVAIFSQFVKPLEELKRRCDEAGIRAVVMTGSTPDSVRNEVMLDFDARTKAENPGYEHKWDVVLAHYKVGGVGMNLTDATQMIIVDEEWNPGKRDQAYGRIHRIGQTKPATVHVLQDKGTIDNWLNRIISDKENMIDGFHEVADNMAQEMFDALKSGLI